MLPEVKAGRLICKQKHVTPPLTDIDPNFGVEYNEEIHGNMLCAGLDVLHLTPSQQTIITALIKKYWCVFSKEGVTIPVKNYECEINTGDAKPIACMNVTFGPRKLPIIEKAISKLLSLWHIEQIYDDEWLSKPLIAVKPHQKNVTDIDDFVCGFCVSYIFLEFHDQDHCHAHPLL